MNSREGKGLLFRKGEGKRKGARKAEREGKLLEAGERVGISRK